MHRACCSKVDADSQVAYLLQRDQSLVNATDYSNDAPLHYAAFKGKGDVVKMLLDQGADVDARGKFGRTALHDACREGHVSCIHELIAGGAQVEARDRRIEATPLHLAAYCNHPDSVKKLVDVYKASANVTDNIGNTALHLAALRGHTDVVRVLVSSPKCDVTVRNNVGLTSADVARNKGHQDIMALLEAK